MNNSDDTVNRSRGLPVCSALSQPIAPPRASYDQDKVFTSVTKFKKVDTSRGSRLWC